MITAINDKISEMLAWVQPVLAGAVVGFLLMSFQNCQRVQVSDLAGSSKYKVMADTDVELPVVDTSVPHGQTPRGDVIVPADGQVRSVYVCPPKTTTVAPSVSSKTTAIATTSSYSSSTGPNGTSSSHTYAVSTGNNVSVSTTASVSSNGTNSVSIKQSGDNNYAYVNQAGPNNTSSIVQNGTNNSACVLQSGEKNSSRIAQTGDRNEASVTQIGGQDSMITQNGSPGVGVSHDSAAACGCYLVHCDSANADLDATCRQAAEQKVIR